MNKRQKIFVLIMACLAAMSIVCAILLTGVCTVLTSQQAADRWRGQSEMPFAQLSVFCPADAPMDLSQVESFRMSLEQALRDASLEAPEGGSLYADAYCAEATLTVQTANGSMDVRTIGVGGEFFLFHPLTLRAGSYLTPRDYMHDRAVIDEELAWALFGSVDVVGMPVKIGEREYPVAGVIRREDDFASRKAYTAGAGMFLCYDAFSQIADGKISCYELVIPNEVSGYGASVLREKFPVKTGVTVENSTRYDLLNLFKVVGSFGTRAMSTHGVVYPYWENAARMTEDYAAALLLLTLLTGIAPVVCVCVLVVRFVKSGAGRLITAATDTFERKLEERKEKRYLKRQ